MSSGLAKNPVTLVMGAFSVKICLMIAYYYELLVEEIAGQKADEAEFIYGNTIESI